MAKILNQDVDTVVIKELDEAIRQVEADLKNLDETVALLTLNKEATREIIKIPTTSKTRILQVVSGANAGGVLFGGIGSVFGIAAAFGGTGLGLGVGGIMSQLF